MMWAWDVSPPVSPARLRTQDANLEPDKGPLLTWILSSGHEFEGCTQQAAQLIQACGMRRPSRRPLSCSLVCVRGIVSWRLSSPRGCLLLCHPPVAAWSRLSSRSFPPPRRCPPFCRPSLRRHPRCLPNRPMPYRTCASRRYGCPRVCPACFALSSLRTPTHPPTQTTNHHRHHQRQGSSGHKPTRIRVLPPPYPRSASVRNSPLSHIRLLNSRSCARISTKHSSTAATVYDGPWTAPQVARV